MTLCFLPILSLLLTACAGDGDTAAPLPQVKTRRIALLSRPADRLQVTRAVEMFAHIAAEAQQGMAVQTRLELEWIDEEEGWPLRVEAAAANPEVEAVVALTTSDNAARAIDLCAPHQKTIILPTATSAELQRTHAGKGHVWFLTEPDMAQSEIMLGNAKMGGARTVYVLLCDNSYGQTFLDWTGFQATEFGMEIGGLWTYGSPSDLPGIVEELSARVAGAGEDEAQACLLFVPAQARDMVELDSLAGRDPHLPGRLRVVCSDKACSPQAAAQMRHTRCNWEGYALSATPASGFNGAYEIEFGEFPTRGEAQLYDALLLLHYGMVWQEAHPGTPLPQALGQVVDARQGTPATWMRDGIRQATRAILDGGSPDVDGASGPLEFDAKKHTTVLHSVFAHWVMWDGRIHPTGYNSTDAALRTSSVSAAWDWAKSYMQFNPDIHITYPPADGRWALILSTSTSWKNYRHQADAFAMYQMLRRHGFDDRHIVLVTCDDYARNAQNLTPGQIRVRAGGANVYDPQAIDYDIRDLQPRDLEAILTGQASERLPHVLRPDADDNVFVFWSGHGSYGQLLWRESGVTFSGYEMAAMLARMSRDKRFAQLFLAIEACYGGSIGEQCEGVPGVLVMTAANAREASWAEQKDSQMHIYLSNAFTRTFEESVDENPGIKLKDLYYNLARTTNGSHVMVYNESLFGNMYETSMRLFLPE